MEPSFNNDLAASSRGFLYFVRLLIKPLKRFVSTVLAVLFVDALPEIYTYIISHQLKEAKFSTVPSSPSSMEIQIIPAAPVVPKWSPIQALIWLNVA